MIESADTLSERNMTGEEKIHFLRNIIPFSSLKDADLIDIAGTLEVTDFSPKTVIIRRGDPGKSFYIIHTGLVKVSLKDKEDDEKILWFSW